MNSVPSSVSHTVAGDRTSFILQRHVFDTNLLIYFHSALTSPWNNVIFSLFGVCFWGRKKRTYTEGDIRKAFKTKSNKRSIRASRPRLLSSTTKCHKLSALLADAGRALMVNVANGWLVVVLLHDLVAVADLVVIPTDDLDKLVGQIHADLASLGRWCLVFGNLNILVVKKGDCVTVALEKTIFFKLTQ